MLKKLLAATVATMIGATLSFTAFAYHGVKAEKPAANTTQFHTKSNQVQIKRVHLLTALPNHLHQDKTLFDQNGVWTKVNKAHLVFFDAGHKRVKELIVHTQDGQRIAVINKPKLSKLVKDNPDWFTNNSATFMNKKDKLYYTTISLDQVWLGEKDGQIKSIAIVDKAPELQK